MLVAFLSWWYGRGWRLVAKSFGPRLHGVLEAFSARQLLRTLFQPWRRIVTPAGRSLEDRWRAGFDNLFSRLVGFVVRSFVLLAAGCGWLAVLLLTALEVIIWPLLPLLIPGCLIAGFIL